MGQNLNYGSSLRRFYALSYVSSLNLQSGITKTHVTSKPQCDCTAPTDNHFPQHVPAQGWSWSLVGDGSRHKGRTNPVESEDEGMRWGKRRGERGREMDRKGELFSNNPRAEISSA